MECSRITHPFDLGAEPLLALEERVGFDPNEAVDDMLYGCVTPIEQQGSNIARKASMVAWGDAVPGM